ncbi:hypothetical protein N799_05165 [Lysobacter arseniciresistens ZS79]|uniref:Uncharacterized protein n=2 Tax=Novilysobacter TaxID=3382699 RepID=A0A0A0F3S4_9GAMM|nr:hypothetical protein N799_05165 [Lysobacter arseniciresistens ZS79]
MIDKTGEHIDMMGEQQRARAERKERRAETENIRLRVRLEKMEKQLKAVKGFAVCRVVECEAKDEVIDYLIRHCGTPEVEALMVNRATLEDFVRRTDLAAFANNEKMAVARERANDVAMQAIDNKSD